MVAQSEEQAREEDREVVAHLENLGFIITTKKTCLEPKKDQTRSIADLKSGTMAIEKAGVNGRSHELCVQGHEKWNADDQSNPYGHTKGGIPGQSLGRQTGSSFGGGQSRTQVVDRELGTIQWKTINSPDILKGDLDGRLRDGLGSSVWTESGP